MLYITFWIFRLISAVEGSYMSDTISTHGLSSDCQPTYMCPTFCLKMQNGCYICKCGESITSYMSSAAEKMKSDYQPIFQTGSKFTSGLMNSGNMEMGLSSGPFNTNGMNSGNPWMGGGDAGSSKWFGTSDGGASTQQGNIGVFNQAQYAPMMTNYLQPDFQEFYRPLTNVMPGYCPPVDHKCPTQCWKTDSFSGCMRCACTGGSDPHHVTAASSAQTAAPSSNEALSTTEPRTTKQILSQSTSTVLTQSTLKPSASPTTQQPKSIELSGARVSHTSTNASPTTGSSSSTVSVGETSTHDRTTITPASFSDSTRGLPSETTSTTKPSSNRANEVTVESTTTVEPSANSATDQGMVSKTHSTSASSGETTTAKTSDLLVTKNDRQMIHSENTNSDTEIEEGVLTMTGKKNNQQTESVISVLQETSATSDNERNTDTTKHQVVISTPTPIKPQQTKRKSSPITTTLPTTHGVYSQEDILSLLGLLKENQTTDKHLKETDDVTTVKQDEDYSRGNVDCPAFDSDCKDDCIVNDLLSGCKLCVCDSSTADEVTTGTAVNTLSDVCSPLPDVCKDDCIDMDENFCPICTCGESDRAAVNPSILMEDKVCPFIIDVCPQQCIAIGEDFCPVCSCSKIIDATTGIPIDTRTDTPTNFPVTDTAVYDDIMSGSRICAPLNTSCPHECLTFDPETFCPACDCSNKD